jgi:hypothetical protein
LEELGVFMGRSLTPERDAPAFAGFDVVWGPRYVAGRAPLRLMATRHELSLLRHLGGRRPPRRLWGWKHPQVYLQVRFLAARFPGLRFVHVIRDGRDMALSHNWNQFDLYGEIAFGRRLQPSPANLARFWAWANARAADDAEGALGSRYLAIRLEDLCEDPAARVEQLRQYVGASDDGITNAIATVRSPPTIGRWRDLPVRERREIERLTALTLERFGYG